MDLIEMITLHEYPLSIVEHVGFKKFCANMQNFSWRIIKRDCMSMFNEMKNIFYLKLESLDCRISLTGDMWTLVQFKGYFALIGHYIDEDWKLKKIILIFNYLLIPHHATSLTIDILEKIYGWNINHQLMSLSLNNCKVNDIWLKN